MCRGPLVCRDGKLIDPGSFGGGYGHANGVNNARQIVGISRYPDEVIQRIMGKRHCSLGPAWLKTPMPAAPDP